MGVSKQDNNTCASNNSEDIEITGAGIFIIFFYNYFLTFYVTDPLTFNFTTKNASCNGYKDGAISITANGGIIIPISSLVILFTSFLGKGPYFFSFGANSEYGTNYSFEAGANQYRVTVKVIY